MQVLAAYVYIVVYAILAGMSTCCFVALSVLTVKTCIKSSSGLCNKETIIEQYKMLCNVW